MAFKKYEKKRVTTAVTVDGDALDAALKAGFNISRICSEAIEAATNPDQLKQKAADQMSIALERESAAAKEKAVAIDYFKARIKPFQQSSQGRYFNRFDEVKLAFWSRKTGLSVDELKALKRLEIDNQSHVSD